MAKKPIKSRRKRTANSFMQKLSVKHLSQEERELFEIEEAIKRKIPDTQERLEYMKSMLKLLEKEND